ncbi:MAG: ribonuclease J [Candidatus Nanopelagicales bacterium]|nr:ribonuclease J [Candidatus Nanopelagicales bacterium]MCF8536678.1 ribonuclease J [Candidatus Nanopelagicales bacterium]MCF8556800.1 ribonuclease J [Candidatus Nanopelagicales bacterium]
MSHVKLPPPPALTKGHLRIVALGGLGEIGRNMTVFEFGDRLLIVDCGVLFPEENQPGVDLILPDFGPIKDRLDDIEAVVLTHGHEDHIGALPYLLRLRADIPILGSQLTLALVEAKLREHRITPNVEVVEDGARRALGPFDVEFLAVNHSIPDAMALAIRTPAGLVLHTGDFKMDQLPLDGRITDLNGFARLGDEGVDLLMVDSTNAEVPGFVSSERDIVPVLDAVFLRAEGRIIVASFASHVHRIQQIIDMAALHGRKIAFVGRSMVRNMGIARDLGYLTIPGGMLVASDDLPNLPDDETVLICTGSQGEPMAVLSRIANRDHPISVGPSDTIVLASSLIPGNENAVFRVINGLAKLGAHVVHKGNALVHVSGHAAAGELTYVYNVVKPKNVLPIHGEWRHMRANSQVAQSVGIPEERITIAEDGTVMDLADGVLSVVGYVPVGFVYVDGSGVGDVTETSLKDRRVLGEEGFISVFVAVDIVDGAIVAGPEIHARGFGADDKLAADLIDQVTSAVQKALDDGADETHELQQRIRRVVGKWANSTHRRRPMIIPVVVEA